MEGVLQLSEIMKERAEMLKLVYMFLSAVEMCRELEPKDEQRIKDLIVGIEWAIGYEFSTLL